jgi:uncharacterized protein (TIGR02302 family)
MSNEPATRRPAGPPAFERKIRLSRAALLFERAWPRLWALIALAALFIVVSLAGVWSSLGEVAHLAVLSAFGLAAVLIGGYIARTPLPTREEAIRRIERRSGVPHRPASAYEDTVTGSIENPATGLLWEAHRARVAALLAKLRVGTPSPRADRFDPLAVRALLMMLVLLFGIAVGDSASDRLRAAFRFGTPVLGADARLDAWVTPPVYTGRPPLILADGSRPGGYMPPAAAENGIIEVPQNSVLMVRASGAKGFVLEVTPDGKPTERVEARAPAADTAPAAKPEESVVSGAGSQIAEVKVDLKASAKVRIVGLSGGEPWVFRVIPDLPPKVALTKDPERTPRGATKLTFKVEDDYGVVSVEGRITRVPSKAEDPATQWARPAANKGPRPPLERPPHLSLRLPRMNAKQAEGTSYHELGSHPWAGMRVRLQLAARDQAGQIGRNEPVEFILPQRRFTNPIAKAVVEQRRLLVEDPRNRPRVLQGLEAITLEPEDFITDRRAYLGLRSAYWRLSRDKSRAGLKSVVEQLWHVALRLEDGNLSDAERALREAQERLAKALQEGASDEEIRQLMNELRQALNDLLEQMARQAEMNPPQDMPQQGQTIRPRDLDRMMRDIENMARQGSREMAQQMLSQLRDLLEQLQNGRMMQGQRGQQGQQGQQMMQMMNEFGDIIGRQQQLLDDTFGEQQRQQGQRGQQGQQGQRGERGQGQQGQGQQRGDRGQQRGEGQGQGEGDATEGLGQRQGELRDRLGRLRQGMGRNGLRAPDQFGEAERFMGQAEDALRRGDLDGATRAEQQALEQLRQGAQSMAQQMMRQFGEGPGGDAPLDPLGRPQRSEGPDFGNSVKIPDEIDVQRAREILEELRRRLGDPSRPSLELDYIDRLLRRF